MAIPRLAFGHSEARFWPFRGWKLPTHPFRTSGRGVFGAQVITTSAQANAARAEVMTQLSCEGKGKVKHSDDTVVSFLLALRARTATLKRERNRKADKDLLDGIENGLPQQIKDLLAKTTAEQAKLKADLTEDIAASEARIGAKFEQDIAASEARKGYNF